MKIFNVTVTVSPPREADDFPGQVEEGCYSRKGNVVTLVSPAGAPLLRADGKTYSKTLGAGEDPHRIAGRLLKERYFSRREKNPFSAPINYPKLYLV